MLHLRYKDDQTLEGYKLGQHARDDMLLLTAVLGVFVGFALTYMGKRGRQLWMFVWGIGLILASIYMGVVPYSLVPGGSSRHPAGHNGVAAFGSS
ncbi:MAG: putative alpha/beta hydrolase [Arenicella sp.]